MEDEGNGSRGRRNSLVLKAETGIMHFTGHAAGIVVEGDPNNPEGRTVDYRPASGGQSVSRIGPDGQVEVHLDGPLDVGEDGELRVLKVLRNALRDSGHAVEIVEIAAEAQAVENANGTDGKLIIDGEEVDVQIVTYPAGQIPWRELAATGTARHAGQPMDAVEWLRTALEHKRQKANGKLLAVDAAYFGAAVTGLAEHYFSAHPDPADEFPFREVWVVGPTAHASTFRLGR